MDYTISYDNNDDSVHCFLQYRFAGENGTTLLLTPPSEVSIDGELIEVDSSDFSGAYYERKFAAKDFAGDHIIVYKNNEGKMYEELFNFHLLRCKEIPRYISNHDMEISIQGAEMNDEISISITDTAQSTEDIELKNILAGKSVIIPIQKLRQLSNGPLDIEIIQARVTHLKNATPEGGRLQYLYTIKKKKVEWNNTEDTYSKQ